MSSNVPDELQKLHESSKALEQNQTALNSRLTDLQKQLAFLENEIRGLKNSIKKKEEISNSDQPVDLKDTVAGFGAKIEALRIDVDSLKENYREVQKVQSDEKSLANKLQLSVDQMANSIASISAGNANNQTSAFYQALSNQCTMGIRNVTAQLTTANYTFNQRIKALDDQIHEHNLKLDGLSESYANVSSHVTSIESEWPKFKSENAQLNNEIAFLKNDTLLLKTELSRLHSSNTRASSSSDPIKKVDIPPMFDLPVHSAEANQPSTTSKLVSIPTLPPSKAP